MEMDPSVTYLHLAGLTVFDAGKADRLPEVQVSTGVHGPGRAKIEERTLRTDRWWLTPLATFLVFSAFVVYATIRAFMGQ